jgi:alkanesulfonate monooxygenase SsuD/methylene tetrahydromethanopterin reductase-like flavin-dependent oxidoreductase (luciferase family)
MGDHERNSTGDWALPAHSRPPLLGELVERIDEALATARASEAAVMTVGAAALDAAEQAKRAAELAERASRAMNGNGQGNAFSATPLSDEGAMGDFTARADRVAERLQRLQRLPLSA